jgi:hypothetical protein
MRCINLTTPPQTMPICADPGTSQAGPAGGIVHYHSLASPDHARIECPPKTTGHSGDNDMFRETHLKPARLMR